jgi:MFS family permease
MADSAQPARSGAHHAVLAGFLGWTLDAFDFFIVVFLFDTLAHQFGVTKKEIVHTTTATLAMRPVGALLFGLLADRYGRRIPLMANVIYFSIIELLSGFSPTSRYSSSCARCLASAWAANGELAHRSRWKPRRCVGAGF